MGTVFEKRAHYYIAEFYYKKALSHNPKFIECHFNLGGIYMRMNNKEKARECLEKCLSINKNYDKARKLLE